MWRFLGAGSSLASAVVLAGCDQATAAQAPETVKGPRSGTARGRQPPIPRRSRRLRVSLIQRHRVTHQDFLDALEIPTRRRRVVMTKTKGTLVVVSLALVLASCTEVVTPTAKVADPDRLNPRFLQVASTVTWDASDASWRSEATSTGRSDGKCRTNPLRSSIYGNDQTGPARSGPSARRTCRVSLLPSVKTSPLPCGARAPRSTPRT